MDLFPDRQHVRLRSCGRDEMYLHANDDGEGVSVSRKRASLHAAWKVHRVVSAGGLTYALLHGAVNGRYLAATRDLEPSGHKGRQVVQREYNLSNFNAVAWRPTRVGAGDEDGGDKVLLLHYSNYVLRANGKHFTWNKGVTVDQYDNRSTMKRWVVEAIPPRPLPPQLPPPVPEPHRGWFWTKMHVGSVVPGVPGRAIRFCAGG